MKLDDRPVIDQLLNPTPLNHLHEAREAATRDLDKGEAQLATDITGLLRERVKELDLDLSADTLDRLDSALESVGDEVAESYAEVQYEALGILVSHLEARL